MRDDSDEIVRALTDRLESLLDTYAPWHFIRGTDAFLSGTPKKPGSWRVQLAGQHRGGWRRFSAGVGGGPIALLAFLLNGQTGEPTRSDFRAAFEEARRFLGLDRDEIDHDAIRRAKEQADAKKARDAAEARAQAARRQDDAQWLWEQAGGLTGTPGEAYLHSRAIRLQRLPDALRWHPDVRHLSGAWSGAILCRVDDADGELVGLWRIFIDNSGRKAFGDQSKLGMGAVGGGAVRLYGEGHGEIGLTEGVETALSVYALCDGAFPVWASLSTSGMRGFQAPLEVHRVRIFADPDPCRRDATTRKLRPSPGLSAAAALRDRLDREGVACIVEPGRSSRGRDYNEALTIASARGAV
jgi:hypothetical protein